MHSPGRAASPTLSPAEKGMNSPRRKGVRFGQSVSGSQTPAAEDETNVRPETPEIFNQTVNFAAALQSVMAPASLSLLSGIDRPTTQLTETELENIHRTFQEFDADGSGTMDLEELKKVMETMGHALTNEQLKELVDQVDSDRSGELDLDEFVQLILLWKEASQFKLFDSATPSIQALRINDALSTKLIKSDGMFKLCWDLFMHAAVMYLWCMTLYFEVINRERFEDWQMYLLGPDLCLSVVMLADVVVTCLTSVRISSAADIMPIAFHDHWQDVLKHYINSLMLFVDVYAILPFGHFDRGTGMMIMALLRLTKAIKLKDAFKYSGRRNMTGDYVMFRLNVMPLVRRLQWFFMGTMLLSVIWTVLKQEGTEFFDSRRPEVNNISGATLALEGKTETDFNKDWTTAVFFIMYTFTTCGYGSVAVTGPYEQIVACLLCICGTLLQGLVIGIIVTVIQKTDIKTERGNKLRETLAVCEYFDIPPSLRDEILQFQDHVLQHNLSQSYSELIRGLPVDMQHNINLFVKIRLVSSVAFFKNAHQGTLVAIAQQLEPDIFLPEQYIIISGEEGSAMFFLSYGFVDVISSEGVQIATLMQGQYFGEMALLSSGSRRKASVKALTYCDVFRLNGDAFDAVLMRFPRFEESIKEEAKRRREELPDSPQDTQLPHQRSPRAVALGKANGDNMEDINIEDGGTLQGDDIANLINNCLDEMANLEATLGVGSVSSGSAGSGSGGPPNINGTFTYIPPGNNRRKDRAPSIVLMTASPEERGDDFEVSSL